MHIPQLRHLRLLEQLQRKKLFYFYPLFLQILAPLTEEVLLGDGQVPARHKVAVLQVVHNHEVVHGVVHEVDRVEVHAEGHEVDHEAVHAVAHEAGQEDLVDVVLDADEVVLVGKMLDLHAVLVLQEVLAVVLEVVLHVQVGVLLDHP